MADYSAIELRTLAEVTGDRKLIGIFERGEDPHRQTAATVLGKALGDITIQERQQAKAINFGLSFGMGAETFLTYARRNYGVALTRRQAEVFKAKYFRAYPGVYRWQQIVRAKMPYEVRTASGRIRRFPSRREGYTERLNLPVQGTAADGMKQALVLLHTRLPVYGARTILTVHDEVVVEVPVEQAEAVKVVVEECMRKGMQEFVRRVPVVVEADVRDSWAAKEGQAEEHSVNPQQCVIGHPAEERIVIDYE